MGPWGHTTWIPIPVPFPLCDLEGDRNSGLSSQGQTDVARSRQGSPGGGHTPKASQGVPAERIQCRCVDTESGCNLLFGSQFTRLGCSLTPRGPPSSGLPGIRVQGTESNSVIPRC